jgi:hypothetical protein
MLLVALTSFGSRATGPPTAVLGEVEILAADTEGIVGTDPSVQLLDALCVTNEATPELC